MHNMRAKYYTYRNLWKGGFSTKLRGIVYNRFNEGYVQDVELRVSEAGNKRAVKTGVRNVHAYAVSDSPPIFVDIPGDNRMKEVKYNPFRSKFFTVNGKPVHHLNILYFKDGKCYTM